MNVGREKMTNYILPLLSFVINLINVSKRESTSEKKCYAI